MPTFVLRQINPELWHRFKQQADRDGLRLLQAMLLSVQGYADGTITLPKGPKESA